MTSPGGGRPWLPGERYYAEVIVPQLADGSIGQHSTHDPEAAQRRARAVAEEQRRARAHDALVRANQERHGNPAAYRAEINRLIQKNQKRRPPMPAKDVLWWLCVFYPFGYFIVIGLYSEAVHAKGVRFFETCLVLDLILDAAIGVIILFGKTLFRRREAKQAARLKELLLRVGCGDPNCPQSSCAAARPS